MKENKLIYRDPLGAPKTLSSNVELKEVVEIENDIQELNKLKKDYKKDIKELEKELEEAEEAGQLSEEEEEEAEQELEFIRQDYHENIGKKTVSILGKLADSSEGGIRSPIRDIGDFDDLDVDDFPEITKKSRKNYTDFTIITLDPHKKGIHVRMSKTTTQTLSKLIYEDKSIKRNILDDSDFISNMNKIKTARSKKDINLENRSTDEVLKYLKDKLVGIQSEPIERVYDEYYNRVKMGRWYEGKVKIKAKDIPEIVFSEDRKKIIIRYKDAGLEKLTINIQEGKVIYTEKTVIKTKKSKIVSKPNNKPGKSNKFAGVN